MLPRAKRELVDLWDLSYKIPYNAHDGTTKMNVSNDNVATRVTNEFRTSIRRIDVPIDSGKIMDLKPSLYRSFPTTTSTTTEVKKVVTVSNVEIEEIDKEQKRAEIKVKMNFMLNELVSGVYSIFK